MKLLILLLLSISTVYAGSNYQGWHNVSGDAVGATQVFGQVPPPPPPPPPPISEILQIEYTNIAGGEWYVIVNGVELTGYHNEEKEALERATNHLLKNPTDDVEIRKFARQRIELK